MLILLPPSEGKTRPLRGKPADVSTLSFPRLNPVRERVLQHLLDLCRSDPAAAAVALELGATQLDAVAENAAIPSRPSAPASGVYSGVLFSSLGYSTLSTAARRRANSQLAIASALWGLLRPKDRIPSYRLSAGSRLPGLGTLASTWREAVAEEISASTGLVLDLRSGGYIALGPVPRSARDRSALVRVLQEREGRRSVVSHMNKATKGLIVRTLLQSDASPTSGSDVADALTDSGHTVEVGSHGGSMTIDVIVEHL